MSKPDASLPVELTNNLISEIPFVGWAIAPLGKRGAQKVAEEWSRNVSTALKAAQRVSGLTREELQEAIEAVPGVIPLTVRILYAAGNNGHDQTLRAMGATLGHAIREPQRIDEAALVLAAMADLGPNHRAILELLYDDPPEGKTWHIDVIREHTEASDNVIRLSVSALAARGLIEIQSGYGINYQRTELGCIVLEVLREFEIEDG